MVRWTMSHITRPVHAHSAGAYVRQKFTKQSDGHLWYDQYGASWENQHISVHRMRQSVELSNILSQSHGRA